MTPYLLDRDDADPSTKGHRFSRNENMVYCAYIHSTIFFFQQSYGGATHACIHVLVQGQRMAFHIFIGKGFRDEGKGIVPR